MEHITETISAIKAEVNEVNHAVKSKTKESNMKNIMNKVESKVKSMVEQGNEFIKNPRSIGVYIANEINNAENKTAQLLHGMVNLSHTTHDVSVLSFTLLKEALKEVKAGYKEARSKRS